MGDNLFEGLPRPSNQQLQNQQVEDNALNNREPSPLPPPPPAFVLKSALKRSKPMESNLDPEVTVPEKATAPGKRLRFKTTTDASETQLIEAMQKIASHIKTPTKFAKASKLCHIANSGWKCKARNQ
ncbi:hypothetical protein GH714_023289 [Hevea brasiliensis]|uniref:Uncharacterized protein n=1 Tax=Hevea brasiliensis TaxID=3981 RepID=A0A6A6M015_HEVBR|nr:hypothetical protein GH714_023289 [Hevea brasiliensis]